MTTNVSNLRERIAARRASPEPTDANDQAGEFAIRRHTDPAERTVLVPQPMSDVQMRDMFNARVAESDQVHNFSRTFHYKPDDGANATADVLRELYGISVGVQIDTLFGTILPEVKTITVGPGKTRQVPWGRIALPALESTFVTLGSTRTVEYGRCFHIICEAPHKWKAELDAFFTAIELKLETGSIYRGKALCGASNLEFLDLAKFDASTIVFSTDVTDVLETALFGAIEHAEEMRKEAIPLKRSFLLYGPYGTGKSSVGQMAGQVAQQNDWTFIMARTGRDNAEEAMRTARMYMPAVVFMEDIDTQASTSDPEDVAELLEAFDGITAKDSELILVMTTNHINSIHAGMLRPGRVDYVVPIGALDRDGTERLLRAVIDPERLAPDTDFNAVYGAMQVPVPDGEEGAVYGFEPAFVRETAQKAKTVGLVRGGGAYQLATDDLVRAARSLHPQVLLLKSAGEGKPKRNLEGLFKGLIHECLTEVILEDRDRDERPPYVFKLRSDSDD